MPEKSAPDPLRRRPSSAGRTKRGWANREQGNGTEERRKEGSRTTPPREAGATRRGGRQPGAVDRLGYRKLGQRTESGVRTLGSAARAPRRPRFSFSHRTEALLTHALRVSVAGSSFHLGEIGYRTSPRHALVARRDSRSLPIRHATRWIGSSRDICTCSRFATRVPIFLTPLFVHSAA